MSETFRIKNDIDVGFLENLTTPVPELAAILPLAKCNGNTVLEEADLFTEGCTATVLQESLDIAKKFNSTPFVDLRVKTIKYLVYRHEAAIKAVWPDFSMPTFGKLVAKYSENVRDIGAMLDRLVPALIRQTQLNSKSAQLFVLTWVNVYAWGKIHQSWVEAGGKPLLAGNEMETFVSNFLERLETGKIQFGIQSQLEDIFAAASYDPKSNRVNYPVAYFHDPFSSKLDAPTTLLGVLLHEVWHSQQDASSRPMTYAQAEIEAYLLGKKFDLIYHGPDKVLADVKDLCDRNWTDIPSLVANPSLRGTPFALWMDIIDDPENLHGKRVFYFNYELAVLAHKELLSGKIDEKGRADLAWTFIASNWEDRATQILINTQTLISQNPAQSIAKGKALPATLILPNLSGAILADDQKNKDMDMFLGNHILRMLLIFYSQGEAEAKKYLTEVYLKDYYERVVPEVLKLGFPADGI